MTGVIATIPRFQFSNALGFPLAGGKLTTYLAGTTTPVATYQDQGLTTANPTTITLDSTGSCVLWLDPTKNYKFLLKDALGVTQPGWPVDNVSGAGALSERLRLALAEPDGGSQIGFQPTLTIAATNVQSAIVELILDLAAPEGATTVGASTPTNTSTTVEAALTMVYPGSRKTLADVLDKIQTGATITIACYGDSLTYGQDTTANGQPSGGLNGSLITRSRYPYPESLDAAFGYASIARSVYNRGYPGDTAQMGYDRWADPAVATPTDVSFIMFGTNDGKTRGVTIADYRKYMGKWIEREIGKGAVVVLIAPPMVVDVPTNTNIQPYTAVLRELAQEYDLQFVDAAEQLSGVTSQWTDGTHLSSFAYSELGWHLLALFVNRDRARQSICTSSIYYPTDFIARGGSLYQDSRARAGYFLQLTPGQFVTIGGYFDDDVQPVITSFKTGGAIGILGVLYAGNGVYRGLPINELAHDPAIAIRQELTTNVLRRGYRVFTITNNGTDNCYIETIEFADLNAGSLTKGMLQKSMALSGVFQSAKQSAVLGDWWTAIDYAHKLKAPWRFTTYLQQSGTGGPGIYVNRQSRNTLSDVLLVLRADVDLLVREIIAGAVTTTTYAGVFATGVYTGEIDLEMTDTGTLNVYVDAVLKASKTGITNTAGFPGFISSVTASKFLCYGAQISGYVKGPY
jgi:lysophospholipase L1-like esterase